MAAKLEATGTYRVLRKLAPRPSREPPPGIAIRQGLFVDTETTGLDPARDEIIELAMVPFTYGLDGEVYAVGEPFQQLREPSKPIPPEITAITGIDDAMVAGHRIEPNEVSHFAAPASLVVAHNAAFDRKFLERFCETFNTKPWACSMSEIDWAAEGYEGTKLVYSQWARVFSTSATAQRTTVLRRSSCSPESLRGAVGPGSPSSWKGRDNHRSGSGRRIRLST